MVVAGGVLILAWYVLRVLGLWWGRAAAMVRRLSPWTRRMHAWVLSAPATFCYVAIFTASTLVQVAAPPSLIRVLTTLESTNLANLSRAELHVLLDSALWVADKGEGLGLYILVFVTVVAWGEQRHGTPRIIVIGLTGHVLGSLLTALLETEALESGRAPARLAVSTDVGVSYMMVAGCAAAVLLMRGRWLAAGVSALAVGVLGPLVWSRSLWDLGHLLATLCGLAAAWVMLLVVPPRAAPDLVGCLPRPRWRRGAPGMDAGTGAGAGGRLGEPGEPGE
ncbi:rhomboid-like protein [Spirillospora sp. NBC_01491]|uniref:rhomboid-like protein n=1 Tax=Spirillospora sp. NBC_01491 TaxID=2976007 RepID=UPI002E321FA0|nr:rhomboid-like protein [Spirillospora sp. NBC_01491]